MKRCWDDACSLILLLLFQPMHFKVFPSDSMILYSHKERKVTIEGMGRRRNRQELLALYWLSDSTSAIPTHALKRIHITLTQSPFKQGERKGNR